MRQIAMDYSLFLENIQQLKASLSHQDNGDYHLHINLTVKDSQNQNEQAIFDKTVHIGHRYFSPEYVREMMLRAIIHEFDETFRLEGKQVKNPHEWNEDFK